MTREVGDEGTKNNVSIPVDPVDPARVKGSNLLLHRHLVDGCVEGLLWVGT